MNKQVTGVEQETSGQEGVRDNGITSAAAEAFFSRCRRRSLRQRSALGGVRGFVAHEFKKTFRFQALMHFSFYLMIAALVLLGLQLAYAFYQLAAFVL